jgi:hypothetical protein
LVSYLMYSRMNGGFYRVPEKGLREYAGFVRPGGNAVRYQQMYCECKPEPMTNPRLGDGRWKELTMLDVCRMWAVSGAVVLAWCFCVQSRDR